MPLQLYVGSRIAIVDVAPHTQDICTSMNWTVQTTNNNIFSSTRITTYVIVVLFTSSSRTSSQLGAAIIADAMKN